MAVMDSGSLKRVWAGIGAKIQEIRIHAQNAFPRNQLFTSAMPFVDASSIGTTIRTGNSANFRRGIG